MDSKGKLVMIGVQLDGWKHGACAVICKQAKAGLILVWQGNENGGL